LVRIRERHDTFYDTDNADRAHTTGAWRLAT